MARSSINQQIVPEENFESPREEQTVILGTVERNEMNFENQQEILTSSSNSCYLSNSAAIASHQIQSSHSKMDDQPKQEGIDGSDQLLNPGVTTPMSNAEMLNLFISKQKQEEEEQMKSMRSHSVPYTITIPNGSVQQKERQMDVLTHESEQKQENSTTSTMIHSDGTDESANEYYASLTSDPQATYEVATFVDDDNQVGQVIVSENNEYSTDAGTVSLGENNITTITLPDGQILTLGDEALEQLAGGTIQLASTQGPDGSTMLGYVLKQDAGMKEDSFNSQQVMMERNLFECSTEGCGKQFTSTYRLKAHERTHTGNTYTCYVCEKPFGSQSDLQKHSKTHLGQKEFVCEIEGCKKEYTTAHHLKVHKRHHSGERPFVCEWDGCGKMFTTGYGLKSHFRTHTNERPYKCQEEACTKAFKTSGDLQKHIRTHTGERPFTCPYEDCDRSFTTSNIRKVHLRTHTGEKPYKCEIEGCGRTFASATNYKNHSRIHTGERPYVCEVPGCSKRFTEYSSLYKHNIVHTAQKPYTCTLCNKTYRQTSTLAVHKRTVHGSDDLTDAEKREHNQSGTPPTKRPKIKPNSRIATSSSSTSTSSYLQGMSLVINNAAATEQTFTAELSAHLQESSEIPGAIAIPIQVTMNPDGTIAGAQGLNLTDGSGRMIPVNLSVSIPMPSFPQLNDNNSDITTDQAVVSNINTMYSETEKLDCVMDMIPDAGTGHVTPRETSSVTQSNEANSQSILSQTHTLLHDQLQTTTSSTSLMSSVLNSESKSVIRTDNYDVDADDADVTDKYLTSHYKGIKNVAI